MNYLSTNLLFLRKYHQLTQADMPPKIGVSRVTWSNYENGVSEPDIVRLIDISDLFKVNIDDLIRRDLSKNIDLLKQDAPHEAEKSEDSVSYLATAHGEANILNEENVDYKKNLKKELDLLILTQLNVIAADVKKLKEKLQ